MYMYHNVIRSARALPHACVVHVTCVGGGVLVLHLPRAPHAAVHYHHHRRRTEKGIMRVVVLQLPHPRPHPAPRKYLRLREATALTVTCI